MNGEAPADTVLAILREIHLAASMLPVGVLAFLIHSGIPQVRALFLFVLFALFVSARWVPMAHRRVYSTCGLIAAALFLLPLALIGHAAAAPTAAGMRVAADITLRGT